MTEDQESILIHSAIQFMKSVTDAYGSDEGLQLWDTISNTLPTDAKGKIFIALLTGESHTEFTIMPFLQGMRVPSLVEMIRTIRNYDRSSPGLKEAKDMADKLLSGHAIKINCTPETRLHMMQQFRKAGFNC